MSNVLCLDIATKTGVCMRVNDVEKHFLIDLSKYTDYANRGWCFHDTIDALIEKYEIDVLVCEKPAPFGRGQNARYLLMGLCFLAQMIGLRRGIDRYEVTPSGLKKFITGKGNANKKAMVEAVTKMGYTPGDDNEADAIAILKYFESEIESGN